MKYFKVKNDILGTDSNGAPNWSDEPLWLREEIDQWKTRYGEDIGGGRFFATEDARYSYIISPNDDLMDLSNDDLEELTEDEILDIIDIAFPPQIIEREGEEDEIMPTPSLEKVCSTYWHYATNVTGNISTSTWTLANNDYHITGNITILADAIITVEPGVNIYFDGNYSIGRQAGSGGANITTFNATGTAALPITIEANQRRLGTAQTGTIGTMFTTANNANTTLVHCRIANTQNVVVMGSATGYTFVCNNNYFTEVGMCFDNDGAVNVTPLTINNCRFDAVRTRVFRLSNAINGTFSHAFNSCSFKDITLMHIGEVSAGTTTVTYTDCFFGNYCQPNTFGALPLVTTVYVRCLQIEAVPAIIATTASATYTDCILTRSTNASHLQVGATATTTNSLTNCDIGMLNYTTSGYALSNVSTTTGIINATSCYISGNRGADFYNYYTGTETPAQNVVASAGVINLTTPRTTRNFPFTQASITESAIGVNTATIAWTGTFRSENRIKYGTTSGVYDMIVTENGSWDNYDGQGQWSISPTIVLSNLKEATTYYYVCETKDLVTGMWNTSAEGTFATVSSSAPTFAGITGLENIGFGGLLVSWGAATGTTTNYNIYIKIGSAPDFTEKPIKVDTTYTSFKITHLSDGTRIQDTDDVYVSVRAENGSTLIDTNTAVLNLYPIGSGATGVIVGDTVAISLKQ